MPLSENLTNIKLPETMQAMVIAQPSEQIAISQTTLSLPQCGHNELLVKVKYVGLNTLDAQYAKTGFSQWQYPHVLGLDAVGIVVRASKGIYPNVGDHVMWHASLADQGVLSDYAKVPNYAVSVIPENICLAQAATLPCAGMTAYFALEKLQVSEGDTLLIEAGAGAVGQYAIQLAKQRGAEVFATGSKANHKLMKSLGADVVFDYHDKKLSEKIRRDLGAQGFDAVIDSIGGSNTSRNIELMRFCGRIACLQPLPEFSQELLVRKAPNISIVSLDGAWLANSLCAQQKMSFISNFLLEGVAKGELKVPKLNTVAFNVESISMALELQLSGENKGRQVVEIK